jgi:NitT/TauT family transport system substrate-binding protein
MRRTSAGRKSPPRNFRTHAVRIIALGASLVASACRDSRPAGVEHVVRAGYLNFTATLPFFVAQENGYFRDEGLRVEADAVGTSNLLVNALAANAIDFAPALSAAPVLALDATSPGRVKIISASIVDADHPFDAILVADTSSMRTIADLRGARIGVFPGTTATRLLARFLADQGVDTSSISFVAIPPANQLAALSQGAVSALHAYEPITTIAETRAGMRQIFGSVYAAQLSPNPQGVAVVTTAFVERDPDTAARLIRAMDRAFRFVQEQQDSARTILISRMQLDSIIARRMEIPWMVPHGAIDTTSLQRYADLLLDIGELPSRIVAASLLYRE